MAAALWFAALCGLAIAAAFVTARARSRPDELVERGPFLGAALALAALAAGGIWVWGGAQATRGHDARIAAGAQVRLEQTAADQTRHLIVRAGDVVQLGRVDAPLPGLVRWELPATTTELVAIPTDPTDCASWPGRAVATRTGCEVHAGAFVFTAIPLIADPATVIDRALRTAIAIATPVLLLCLALAASPRSRRRASALSRVLRLATLAGALAALASWRLLWAYRIDMLRDLAPLGRRVADNQLAAALVGATLAALATRRVLHALAAWAAWLAVAWLVLGLPALQVTPTHVVTFGLSLAAAFAPRASELAELVRRHAPRRLAPEQQLGELGCWAIAASALVAHAAAPRGVLVKLALAYALVLAGHAAIRATLSRTGVVARARAAAALAAATLALAHYDTGVTLAIAGAGLALAMLIAGHDAIYDSSSANRIGVLEREHARLLAAHGIIAVALAGAAIVASAVASDRAWLERAADVACQAPLVAAVLFLVAAALARVHRRAWLPHLVAAIAAIAVWSVRADVLARATEGHGVVAHRVTAVVEPGYAMLRDGDRFAATAAAWREASANASATGDDLWRGPGLFGARIADPGVVHSIENDYLPVLVAREEGIGGIAQTAALLLLLVTAVGAFASAAHRHASRAQRGRWLVAVVIGMLCLYQPLASLGILPLTGISWPGLGIDSPSDLWVLVIALAWCGLGGTAGHADDDRVRATPRVIRARKIATAALAACAAAGGSVVARSAAIALARVPVEDARIAAALHYAHSLSCPWRSQEGALDAVIPTALAGTPTDDGTARYDAELHASWQADRSALVAAAPACHGTAGHWQLAGTPAQCRATFRAGGPEVVLALAHEEKSDAWRATCSVDLDEDVLVALRGHTAIDRGPRIRVVSQALGAAAADVGELVAAPAGPAATAATTKSTMPPAADTGTRVIRLRTGAPTVELATTAAGISRAGTITLAPGVAIVAAKSQPLLRVDREDLAELFIADAESWRHVAHAREVALDRISLVVAGPAAHRVVVLVRPPRAWSTGGAVVDPLLADDSDGAHRAYPVRLPELGWLDPDDPRHAFGLDGWIHAAQRQPATASTTCGTLSPPPISREQVCTPNPLDGVLECRVALQPELVLALRDVADKLVASPKAFTGHDAVPTRVAFVALRGDTGEILAQGTQVPGRDPLGFAPADRAAEAALMQALGERGESDRERVEWNLPIAVGSTFKPIVARAAELAFPQQLQSMVFTAAGETSGCKARNGKRVSPLLGHCPPTTLAGDPTTADVHDFLERSPNWYQAALGLTGLALPDGTLSVQGQTITLEQLAATDLMSWPTKSPLEISDAQGPIVRGHSVRIDGMRRTPLWQHVEGLLGRPLCTLGDRASCERAADRADVCAARALPVAEPSRELRYLVALGPDTIDPYADDRAQQSRIPVREYFQLLRGSGAHPLGSLAQLTAAFGRVVYGDAVAASWFPAPVAGKVPDWSCAVPAARRASVLGAGGGLCAVVQRSGTTHGTVASVLADPQLEVYGAKTGTTDSLAGLARNAKACAAWNASHAASLHLACGKKVPDDSLFVIAFGVVTDHGTIPITLGIQLQRAGTGAAAHSAPSFIAAIASYFRS